MNFNDINAFTEEEKEQLLELCLAHPILTAAQKAAEPPPAGLGRELTPRALREFYLRHIEGCLQQRGVCAHTALAAWTGSRPRRNFAKAARQALEQTLFLAALNPKLNFKESLDLYNALLKKGAEDLEKANLRLARKKHALEQRKYEESKAATPAQGAEALSEDGLAHAEAQLLLF